MRGIGTDVTLARARAAAWILSHGDFIDRLDSGQPLTLRDFKALGRRSGRDLALDAAAGPLDECGDQLAGILQAHRGILRQADAAATLRAPRQELADRQRRDRGLLATPWTSVTANLPASHGTALKLSASSDLTMSLPA
jgi:hypothetical protein